MKNSDTINRIRFPTSPLTRVKREDSFNCRMPIYLSATELPTVMLTVKFSPRACEQICSVVTYKPVQQAIAEFAAAESTKPFGAFPRVNRILGLA